MEKDLSEFQFSSEVHQQLLDLNFEFKSFNTAFGCDEGKCKPVVGYYFRNKGYDAYGRYREGVDFLREKKYTFMSVHRENGVYAMTYGRQKTFKVYRRYKIFSDSKEMVAVAKSIIKAKPSFKDLLPVGGLD